MKEGIDVSVYQGQIDWEKIKTDFVFIKEGQGVGAWDKNCLVNAQGAEANKIPFGYYHFATLNKPDVLSDSSAEAMGVLTHLNSLPKATLIFALDVETNEINLSSDEIEIWINNFVRVMGNNGIKVMLYSGAYWLNTNLKKDHQLGSLPLWIAEYTSAELPVLPNGWKDFAIWQYTEKGVMLGITGNVDMNHAKNLISA